jgi:hypothetical protein
MGSTIGEKVAGIGVDLGNTKETVKDMGGTIRDIGTGMTHMIAQLNNIESILKKTLEKVDSHIDNHDDLVYDAIDKMNEDQLYDLYKKIHNSDKVKKAKKEEWENNIKTIKGNVSWKILVGLSAALVGSVSFILGTLIKLGILK